MKISRDGKGQKLYKKAKDLIPGGTQLLSKRPELFLPELWPAYYRKAKGCEVWDLDGNRFIDMSYMGVGSCILGYADEEVNNAVKKAVDRGSMCTLNAPEEVELAELLLKLHPWAGMARYARCGGEAMAVAVRIARAKTRRDIVLFCGYHGWHDWYLSANLSSDRALDGHLLPGLSPCGVPRKLKGTSYPFKFNDTESFLKLVSTHKNNVGAVVMEPIRSVDPDKEFLCVIKQITKDLRVPLIVDEVTAGFRLHLGGAHLLFGLEPDIAVFAKGMSNGFPMAAVIGNAKVMEAAQDSFISSTYWTDRIGPAAALAAIEKMRRENIAARLISSGRKVKSGWKRSAEKHGIEIEIGGMDPMAHFSFIGDKRLVFKTIFTQEMLKRGFLATNAFYASFSHKNRHIDSYLEAVEEVFRFIKGKMKESRPERYLNGPVCASGFKRLT